MLNTLCGSMGSLSSEVGNLKIEESGNIKCENSRSILLSSNESSSSSSTLHQSDHKQVTTTAPLPASDFEDHTVINGISFPAVKFEVAAESNGAGDDVGIQSPDHSYWDTFFADQLEGDFMISSPVRSMASPQVSSFINDVQMMITSPVRSYAATGCGGGGGYHHHGLQNGIMSSGCSPPRMMSPLGQNNNNKGKGLSPLNRVFNSPNAQQFMQTQDANFPLPALENLLDFEDDDDNDFSSYSTLKLPNLASSNVLTAVPESLLDCGGLTTLPHSCSASSFVGSLNETTSVSVQASQEEDDIYHTGSLRSMAPLSQQLREEHNQEQHIRRQHAGGGGSHLQNSIVGGPAAGLVVPLPAPPAEQVYIFTTVSNYY